MAFQLHSTIFGQLVRLLSGKRLFRYPDEIDPSLWKKTVQRDTPEQTNMSTGKSNKEAPNANSQNRMVQCDGEHNGVPGILLVGWYGPDDPEVWAPAASMLLLTDPAFHFKNPQNWSNNLKHLIAFQMCLLNFSVYIASSIYVPGEASLIQEFGVSDIVATLGLSLFTL